MLNFFREHLKCKKFKSVEDLVNQLKPDKPVYCIRKNSILSASKYFQQNFPGKVLYAVKTNPHKEVIKTLIESGITQFDVASIEEIKAVREFSHSAKCSFMHTIKSKDRALISKKLVTLKNNVPIDKGLTEFQLKEIDKDKLYKFLREMGTYP